MRWINELMAKKHNTPQNAHVSFSGKNFWVYYYAQMNHMVSSGTVLQ